jgi:hypothetical protein
MKLKDLHKGVFPEGWNQLNLKKLHRGAKNTPLHEKIANKGLSRGAAGTATDREGMPMVQIRGATGHGVMGTSGPIQRELSYTHS